MAELTNGVNWIAVIVGAVAAFLAGWVWYSPMLFGKKWAEGNGLELGNASEMPIAAMVTQVVGLLLVSWFVGVTAASNLLATVILAAIAFTVMAYSGGLFRRNNTYVRNVDAGYWIFAVILMIVAQGIF